MRVGAIHELPLLSLPIVLTFLGTDLREFTHLDSIVTVVDAETFNPREHYESDVAIDQIFCGDIIILNKTDLVSHERANKTEDFLRSVKEGARILRSEHSKVPLSLMLDTNLSGKWLAAGGLDGSITLWRIDSEIPELFDTNAQAHPLRVV
jgi:G3E family GTPase